MSNQPCDAPARPQKLEAIFTQDSTSSGNGTGTYSCWRLTRRGYVASLPTVGKLPAAVYKVDTDGDGDAIFSPVEFPTDDLYELGDEAQCKVLDRVERFSKAEQQYRDVGFLYKTGIFLYGPPGGGKTCLIRIIINKVIAEHNGIAVLATSNSPDEVIECMRQFRKVEPDRMVVMVYEDLDEYIEKWKEAEVLSLLDGENQIAGVVHIATTNYPQNLSKRFLDRPSRFDLIERVGLPDADKRRSYLQSTYPKFKEEWIAATEGLGIAHLRDLVVAVACNGTSAEEAIKRLKGQHKLPVEDDGGGPVGFTEGV